jgi:hypothetical protein
VADPEPRVTPYVLERYEDGEWAVLEREDGATFMVPRFWLPKAREGDVLIVQQLPDLSAYGLGDEPSSTLDIYVDEAETARRKAAASALRARLPKGPEGDLEL